MTVPMKRGTSTRQGRRRRNVFIRKPAMSLCPQCKSPKLPHHVCPVCGFYKANRKTTNENLKSESKK